MTDFAYPCSSPFIQSYFDLTQEVFGDHSNNKEQNSRDNLLYIWFFLGQIY